MDVIFSSIFRMKFNRWTVGTVRGPENLSGGIHNILFHLFQESVNSFTADGMKLNTFL